MSRVFAEGIHASGITAFFLLPPHSQLLARQMSSVPHFRIPKTRVFEAGIFQFRLRKKPITLYSWSDPVFPFTAFLTGLLSI